MTLVIATPGKEIKENGSGSGSGSGLTYQFQPGQIPRRYMVNYSCELISSNTMVRPDGCSSITFENIGEDQAEIFGAVPLFPAGPIREFLNRPGEVISSNIPIMFKNQSVQKAILVTKIYYTVASID